MRVGSSSSLSGLSTVDFFPVFPWVFSPGVSWLPLTGFNFAGLVGWLILAPQSWNPPSRSTPFSRFITFWRLCDASWSLPLFPRSLWRSLASWTSGLAIASLPLVSHPWTVLYWSHLMSHSSVSDRLVVVPRQLLGSGVCSPASTICPPSRVFEAAFLRVLCFDIAPSLRDEVTLPGRVLSQCLIGTKALPPPSWCFGRCLRDEVTLTGRVFLRPRSERRLFAHLP